MVGRKWDSPSGKDTLRLKRGAGDESAPPSRVTENTENKTSSQPGRPVIRLTDSDMASPGRSLGAPIQEATDPRWVLALRTAESLDGSILSPEKREKLVRLGKVMGLTAFDANLVIAIVQDQARRGYAPQFCPAAGEQQLRMVPLPRRERSDGDARLHRIFVISMVIATLIGVELIVLKWIFS
ncbi:MAG: hypothetical protein WD768_01620 [Phycisphaeraceae bacterium]